MYSRAIRVDVWSVRLAGAQPPAEAELALLNLEERSRHAAFLVPDAARVFATTRIALRRLLSERLARAPCDLAFTKNSHGKPFLVGHEVFFNVSHCRTRALIALCEAAPVGIDIEERVTMPPDQRLVAQLCSPKEAHWLKVNGVSADAALGRLWSRKEAVLKAHGAGLAGLPLAELDLGDPGASAGSAAVGPDGVIGWRDLDLSAHEVAAVAVVSSSETAIEVAFAGHASDPM